MINRKEHIEELLEVTRFLRRKVSDLSHIDGGITGSQWLVVVHVFKHEGSTINDAAAALNMSGSAVTQLVNGLVKKGYIKREKNPQDRRAHNLTLSSESKRRINEFKKKRAAMMLKMFAALNDKEFEQYLALNKKIIQKISSK